MIMVAAFLSDYLRARIAAGSIFKLMDLEPKIDSCSTKGLKPVRGISHFTYLKKFQEITGSIKFKNVSFSYPNSQRLVLNYLNVELTAQKSLALVGPSGGGAVIKIADFKIVLCQNSILILCQKD